MPEPDLDQLERYLLKGERIVVAVHRHWAVVAEPVVTTTLALVVVTWLTIGVDEQFDRLADVAWLVWFAVLGRAVWMLYEWKREWFLATDRRLLLVYGFIVRKVDMMPLGKVTDMTYDRSIPGRLLGYGTFVLESAGQDQALSRVAFIPHPDQTYRAMIGQIFHRDGDPEFDEGTEYEEYAARAADEADPRRRASFLRRLRQATGLELRERPEDEGLEEGIYLPREVPRDRGRRRHESRDRQRPAAQNRRPDPTDDEPETESLWQTSGESIYHSDPSDGTADSPVTIYRDDTTGWWHGR